MMIGCDANFFLNEICQFFFYTEEAKLVFNLPGSYLCTVRLPEVFHCMMFRFFKSGIVGERLKEKKSTKMSYHAPLSERVPLDLIRGKVLDTT